MRSWSRWLLAAAAALAGAGPALALTWEVAPAAGVLQYYEPGGSLAAVCAGTAVNLAARAQWGGGMGVLDGRWRFYRETDQDLAWEGGAFFFFHPAPARPYIGPTLGFGRPRRADRTANALTAGIRAGGLLTAEDERFHVDIYGGYRAQYLPGEDNRPNYYSEVYIGGAGDWMFSRHVGVRAIGEIGWPGYFGLEHVGPAGPTVAPAFLLGPALAF